MLSIKVGSDCELPWLIVTSGFTVSLQTGSFWTVKVNTQPLFSTTNVSVVPQFCWIITSGDVVIQSQ